jgi:tungstate transport system ATP-binding protein
MTSDTIIEINHLRQIYDGTTVLDIDSYRFRRGRIYALVGPNGCGKSTLLLILSLLIPFTSGRIVFDGIDVSSADSYEIRRRVTLVHQEPVMFHASVRKNVAIGPAYRDLPREAAARRVREAVAAVGMTGFEQRNARTLSGGEKKRIAIARALAVSPDLLLLDEPTANVDATNSTKIEQIIRSINEQEKTTIIFSTHNLNQAYRLAHEVITLMYGKPQEKSLRNIFSGYSEVIDGEPVFNTGRIRIKLPKLSHTVHQISIDPHDIIISRQEVPSSARNLFRGQIIELNKDEHLIGVIVRAREDFRVTITERSFRDMGLSIGEEVYIAFKATAVATY